MMRLHGKEVMILGEFEQLALRSAQFRDWASDIDSRFDVKSIDFKSVNFSPHDKAPQVRFMTTEAEVVHPNGKRVKRVTFMRGGSVAILLVLVCDGKEYTVLTRQPRFSIGQYAFLEIPAGTIDQGGKFAGEAARELFEETTIEIREEDLIDLIKTIYGENQKGVYASPGGTDEYFRIFVRRMDVSMEFLSSLQGKETGLASESEEITLVVIPLQDLPLMAPDAKSLAALTLYETAKKLGKLEYILK